MADKNDDDKNIVNVVIDVVVAFSGKNRPTPVTK